MKLWLRSDGRSIFTEREIKLLLFIYRLKGEEGKKKEHASLWLLNVFYSFPNGNRFNRDWIVFSKLVHFCGNACCVQWHVLCMESVNASTHVAALLLLRANVEVFPNRTVHALLDHAESTLFFPKSSSLADSAVKCRKQQQQQHGFWRFC